MKIKSKLQRWELSYLMYPLRSTFLMLPHSKTFPWAILRIVQLLFLKPVKGLHQPLVLQPALLRLHQLQAALFRLHQTLVLQPVLHQPLLFQPPLFRALHQPHFLSILSPPQLQSTPSGKTKELPRARLLTI